nr:hypothetical protein [Evansella caseinilytica]
MSSGETTQRRDSQALYPGLIEHPHMICVQKGGHNSGKKVEARQARAAERTRTYVSNGGTTQRRDSQALYPGLIEHPHMICVQKGGHNSGKKVEARQARAAERTRTYVSNGETTQRRDSQALYPGLIEHPLK